MVAGGLVGRVLGFASLGLGGVRCWCLWWLAGCCCGPLEVDLSNNLVAFGDVVGGFLKLSWRRGEALHLWSHWCLMREGTLRCYIWCRYLVDSLWRRYLEVLFIFGDFPKLYLVEVKLFTFLAAIVLDA